MTVFLGPTLYASSHNVVRIGVWTPLDTWEQLQGFQTPILTRVWLECFFMTKIWLILILVGGNSNIVYFYPKNWGRWNQFDDRTYVSNGLVKIHQLVVLLKLISDLRVFPHDDLKYTAFTPYICVFDGWKVFEKSVLKPDAPNVSICLHERWKMATWIRGNVNKGKCMYSYVNNPIPWSIGWWLED